MRRTILVSLLLSLAFLASACAGGAYRSGPSPAPGWGPGPGPDLSVEVSFFYDELAPYGDWMLVEPYGWVWTPWDVAPGRRAVPLTRNPELLRQTRDVTRYEAVGDRVAVRGVPVAEIEQRAGRAVPRYEVRDVPAPPPRAERVERDRVRVYRPEPTRRTPTRKPPAEERRKAVPRKPPA